jgi:hypothetical protein
VVGLVLDDFQASLHQTVREPMRVSIALATPLATLFVAGLAFAKDISDVSIDYAKDMDFAGVKTFEYVPPKVTGSDSPLMAERTVELVKAALTDAGLTETQEDPDMYVTYHLTTEQDPQLDDSALGYGGHGPGWGSWGGGMGTSRAGVSTETGGALIIDAYRPSDKKLVWRGTGTFTPASTLIKRSKQIEDIIDELGKRWKKILRNAGE